MTDQSDEVLDRAFTELADESLALADETFQAQAEAWLLWSNRQLAHHQAGLFDPRPGRSDPMTIADQPTYINLTPHDVVIRDHDDMTTVYPASGTVARVVETVHPTPSPDLHRRVIVQLGDIEGLPPARDGVVHIVSMPCAMALAAAGVNRPDVVYPHHLYRDEDGRIAGADQLARIEGAA